MTIRFSTGLRNKILDADGLRTSLASGVIKVYSGPQPPSADDVAGGSLLLQITVDGGAWSAGSPTNGLNFDAPVDGVINKAALENWQGSGLAQGTAGWFRFYANEADDGTNSTTAARIDGTVARTGGDITMSNVSVTIGQPNTVDIFQIEMREA